MGNELDGLLYYVGLFGAIILTVIGLGALALYVFG